MYTDPASVRISFPPVPPEPDYRKHKRIYVSLNVTAESIRQIRLRYSALTDQLIEYDRSADGRQAQVDSPEERKAYFDLGYTKRHEVIGAAWDLVGRM